MFVASLLATAGLGHGEGQADSRFEERFEPPRLLLLSTEQVEQLHVERIRTDRLLQGTYAGVKCPVGRIVDQIPKTGRARSCEKTAGDLSQERVVELPNARNCRRKRFDRPRLLASLFSFSTTGGSV